MARKDSAEAREDIEVDEGSGPRVYELGFHLDAELPAEEVKKTYSAMKSLIESKGAVVAEGEPLMTRLAYTISRQETTGRRDFDSAYFCWIAYETSVANHDEILAVVKEDKRIVRFIDLISNKEAARQSAELRDIAAKVAEPAGAATSADAALDAAIENAAV